MNNNQINVIVVDKSTISYTNKMMMMMCLVINTISAMLDKFHLASYVF